MKNQDSKPASPPAVGSLVHDTKRNRDGIFMALQAGRFLLRPPGGGREWEAKPDDVQPADAHAQLSARVRELNAQSRRTL